MSIDSLLAGPATTPLATSVLLALAQPLPAEPLASWNEGPAKEAIVRFVKAVDARGSASFVPADERIAVFDNDGTLWPEQPIPVQFAFALDRVKAVAGEHPEWKPCCH
jgi:hypothetical protein